MRPSGGRVARRPARELDDHHVAGRRARAFRRRHLHVGEQPTVERHDVAEPGLVRLEAADELTVRALEDPDDPALDAIGAVLMLDARDDAVAVERFLHVGRDEM